MDLNKVQLIGRATQDPEVKSTQGGTSVCSFSVATSYSYTDKNTGEKTQVPEYHNCVAWRGLADTIGRYIRKGSRIYVEGRLQTRSWDDPNGVKKYKTEIIVDNMIMLDNRGKQETQTPQAQSADYSQDISIDQLPF